MTLSTPLDDDEADRLQSFVEATRRCLRAGFAARPATDERRARAADRARDLPARLRRAGERLVNLVNRMPAERYRHAIVCLAGFSAEFRQRIQRAGRRGHLASTSGRARTSAAYGANVAHCCGACGPTSCTPATSARWTCSGSPRRPACAHGCTASTAGRRPIRRGCNPRGLRIRRACRPVIHRYVPMSRDIARLAGACGRGRPGADPPAVQRRGHESDSPARRAAGERRQAVPPAGDRVRRLRRIGTVGRLDPVKNQASLLEAFAASDRDAAAASNVRLDRSSATGRCARPWKRRRRVLALPAR